MKSSTRSIVIALLAAGGLASATLVSAQGSRSGSTYQRELSVCGHNQQDRAACIREAGAARQEAARGGLTSAPDYRANALARCGLQQTSSDRAACEARVLGGSGNTQASVEGSVMGGGVIRESVTTVVMPAPATMPAPIVVPQPAPPLQRAPDPIIAPRPMPMPMPAPAR